MDPILQPLLQYGVLGIFAVLLIVFAKSLLKREQDRGDSSQNEVTRLNNLIQDKMIPALTSANQAIVQVTALLQGLQYQRDVEQAAAAAARKKEKP